MKKKVEAALLYLTDLVCDLYIGFEWWPYLGFMSECVSDGGIGNPTGTWIPGGQVYTQIDIDHFSFLLVREDAWNSIANSIFLGREWDQSPETSDFQVSEVEASETSDFQVSEVEASKILRLGDR